MSELAGWRNWSRVEWQLLLARMLRFGLVGVLATLTHATIAVATLRWFGLPPLLANGAGWCIAVAVSFCGHSFFTFRAAMSLARALRFAAVALGSVAFSSGLVLAAQRWTPLRPELYLPLVALCVPVFNFICHSLWTFRRAPGIVG
jgi:putative flippase GtrA